VTPGRRSTVDPRMLDNDEPLLRQGWHPVADERELTGGLLRVWLLGEPWVLLETGGRLHAFVDRCPHRRSRLSTGELVDGELVCPYHGFRFAVTGTADDPTPGRCTAMPILGPVAPVPPLSLRAAWGVQRRYGLVWLAPEEPLLDLPSLPRLEEPGLRVGVIRTSTTAAAGLLVDNFLDVAHFSYLHAKTLGADAPVTAEHYRAERRGWQAVLTHRAQVRETGSDTAPTGERTATYTFTPPYTTALDIDFSSGTQEAAVLAVQPETADRSTAWVLVAWPDDDPEGHERALTFSAEVLAEDLAILEDIDDPRLPLEPRAEFHSRGDRAGIEMRRILGDYLTAAAERIGPR
jgi:phenylpropionate dioxygenase-like ring-hydroxylating dioxygenase large terminal subunit